MRILCHNSLETRLTNSDIVGHLRDLKSIMGEMKIFYSMGKSFLLFVADRCLTLTVYCITTNTVCIISDVTHE